MKTVYARIIHQRFNHWFRHRCPCGPIGVICIQRTLHDGFNIGFMTGMGAALADGTYGLIAGFGLTAISSLLIMHQFWIRLIGGLFLLYLDVKLFMTVPRQRATGKSDRSSWDAFSTTYLLTVTYPATILAFAAVFAGLGLGTSSTDYSQAIILVSGIILGSAIWWLSLSGGVAFVLHHRLSPFIMRSINKLSGTIIIIFGIYALLTTTVESSIIFMVPLNIGWDILIPTHSVLY